MMAVPAPTFDAYLETVRRSGLIKGEELDSLAGAVASPAKPGDFSPLARRLMDQGLVTSWQHAHLLEGRHRGFFLGNYKLLKLLGSGGMGAVYVAEHTFMHRRVAVKVLYEAQVDKTNLERFYLECRAIASLDHPNIVRAHDFDSNGEFMYLVMEFIDGPDLHTLVQRSGALPVGIAASFIKQSADGLHHAHSAGMVHRDIKPANLLCDPKGILKILDLGLARITNRDEKNLTMAHNGGILGTVDFLAPEQAVNSHNVDHRADIYSLGCTFYYLLTGVPPFKDGSVAQKLMAHQCEQPRPIEEHRSDLPKEVTDLIRKMMVKKPEQRIQTAVDVARILAPFEEKPGPLGYGSRLAKTPGSKGGKGGEAVAPAGPGSKGQPGTGPGSKDTKTVRQETLIDNAQKVHLRCDQCKTVFRATPEKAARIKTCPKCNQPLVRV